MINIVPDKYPIVIVASPRTGSTALLLHLANKFNITNVFGEIFIGIEDLINATDKIKNNAITDRTKYLKLKQTKEQNFIVKLMPKEINLFSDYDNLLKSNCYKILLQRKSLVNQIASLYIARQTKKLHTYDSEQANSFSVKINMIEIVSCIELITHYNFLCNNLPYKFDLTLNYDELEFIPNTYGTERTSNHTYSHKPINYEELCNIIKNIINGALRQN